MLSHPQFIFSSPSSVYASPSPVGLGQIQVSTSYLFSPSLSSSSFQACLCRRHHLIISIIHSIPTHHHRHQFISLPVQLSSLRYNMSSVLLAFVPPPGLNYRLGKCGFFPGIWITIPICEDVQQVTFKCLRVSFESYPQ